MTTLTFNKPHKIYNPNASRLWMYRAYDRFIKNNDEIVNKPERSIEGIANYFKFKPGTY
jgi:hypothetical protein